jgi:hypothetical protein
MAPQLSDKTGAWLAGCLSIDMVCKSVPMGRFWFFLVFVVCKDTMKRSAKISVILHIQVVTSLTHRHVTLVPLNTSINT